MAYLVPAELTEVVGRLRAHGVQLEEVTVPATLAVERFRVTESEVAARAFQGHQERRLEGAYEAIEMPIPAGTLRVDMTQPLARLAFYLLEPRSDDGLANWNFLDDALESIDLYPVVRIPAGS